MAPPNVLLIVADDLPRNIIGSYGANHSLFPQLDSLGQTGLVFTNAYTVAPLCTPSRYSLLTGTYASRGARDNNADGTFAAARQVDFQVFLERKSRASQTHTMAHMFADAGFMTGMLGKYHVGRSLQPADCASTRPDTAGNTSAHAAPSTPFVRASLLSDPSERAAYSCQTIGNQSCLARSIQQHAGFSHVSDIYYDNDALTFYAHQPEWMAHEAVSFIRTARKRVRPFFLWMAPSLTHSPSDVVQQLQSEPRLAAAGCGTLDGFDGDPVKAAHFQDAVLKLRASVLTRLTHARLLCKRNATSWRICPDEKLPSPATLLSPEPFIPAAWFTGDGKAGDARRAALATSVAQAAWLDASLAVVLHELRLGEPEQTLTIFTADHGPYFAGKGHAFEAGIRVPLIMHWTGGQGASSSGRTITARVTHLDVLPTLTSLIGTSLSASSDGRDISVVLRGEALQAPEKPLIIEVGFSRTIILDGFKLILTLLPREAASDPQCRSIHGIKVPPAKVAEDDSPKASKIKFMYDVRERHPAHHCDRVQLYDLTFDPAEQHNLAAEQPEHVQRMRTLLLHHVTSIEGSAWDAAGDAPITGRVTTAAKGGVATKGSVATKGGVASKNGDPEATPDANFTTARQRQPKSWCQTCHPSTACPPWPAESTMFSKVMLDPMIADLVRAYARNLVADMGGNASADGIARMRSMAKAVPYAPREKCVLLRASGGRLLIDFLGTAYADQSTFSIASCFPSKKGNYLRSRLHVGLRLLLRVLRQLSDLPDFEIGYCPDDCSPALSAEDQGVLPALTSVRCAGRSSLPFVAWTVNSNRATDLSEWDEFIEEWSRRARTVPWADRIPKAVFRGHLRPFTVCGGWPAGPPRYNEVIDASNWKTLGRSAIWKGRIDHPEALDVNFDNSAEMASRWKLSPLEAAALDEPKSISMEEQARRFRYAIHPEGQCGFADRLKTIMALPMLVFKQANPCSEWYEGLLVAGEHYAPVDGSYANLTMAIAWAQANDAEAQRIAAQGHERIRQVVSVAGIYVYVEELIRSYARRYAAHTPSTTPGGRSNFTHEFSCAYGESLTQCTVHEIG